MSSAAAAAAITDEQRRRAHAAVSDAGSCLMQCLPRDIVTFMLERYFCVQLCCVHEWLVTCVDSTGVYLPTPTTECYQRQDDAEHRADELLDYWLRLARVNAPAWLEHRVNWETNAVAVAPAEQQHGVISVTITARHKPAQHRSWPSPPTMVLERYLLPATHKDPRTCPSEHWVHMCTAKYTSRRARVTLPHMAYDEHNCLKLFHNT